MCVVTMEGDSVWRMPERMAYMSISIKAKTDYTGMLSNLSSSNSISGLTNSVTGNKSGSSAFGASSSMSSLTKNVIGAGSGSTTLSDYAAIKNGSYAKLMKAYYSEVKSDKSTSSDKSSKTDKTSKSETSSGEGDSSSSSSSAVNSSYDSKGTSSTMAEALSSVYNQFI